MEHIVQFGVTIDDDKIEKLIIDKASTECLTRIKSATDSFTKGSYYSDSELSKMFKAEVKKVVEDHKEQIIADVVKTVSTNLMKTKAVVEAKAKLVASLEGE